MSPSKPLLPICCCFRRSRKKKNQKPKSAAAAPSNGHDRLAVPTFAVNGRVVISSSLHRAPPFAERVVIDMPEDFSTARTSRDRPSNHLSMKELMRTVRREEGLKVTPRDDESSAMSSGRSLCMTDDRRELGALSPLQELDAKRLAPLEFNSLKRATFNSEDDITARAASIRSSRSALRSACSVATISGDDHLFLPPAAPDTSAARYLSVLPQMLVAIVSISIAWLANLVSLISR